MPARSLLALTWVAFSSTLFLLGHQAEKLIVRAVGIKGGIIYP